MKKKITILLSLLCFVLHAQYQKKSNHSEKRTFVNPIFSGDYPDPSILVDGDNYYIVHSSFDYYPGLTIWHSKDLINWTPITNALHKYVGSVWAPDLVKYKDTYYIYFPANNTNYVVTANAINGPWSDPIDLKIENIDPGHVVDAVGNRYLYFNNGGYVHLTKEGLSVTGALHNCYEGWEIPRDWTIECFCMEGPKLFKRNDYYYLITAEGGTAGPATGHMVIAARSKSPIGPWENSPYNPIVRAKTNMEKWWSVGHGTVFEDSSKKWWMIFHGYEKGFYNMGRQTLLSPIEWTDEGWFKIPDNVKIDEPIEKSKEIVSKATFSLSDNFQGNTLRPHWKFFGAYDTNRFSIENKTLAINAKGNAVADSSPLLCMPSDHSYTAQVELEIEGDATGGLVLFYNEKAYSGILSDGENILANLRGWQFPTEKKVIKKHVFLRLKNINNTVDMFYSIDGENWVKIENSVEVAGYHHNVLSGFLGLRIGLCSVGTGVVKFKNFVYTPI